jgi:hypothetical protein
MQMVDLNVGVKSICKSMNFSHLAILCPPFIRRQFHFKHSFRRILLVPASISESTPPSETVVSFFYETVDNAILISLNLGSKSGFSYIYRDSLS